MDFEPCFKVYNLVSIRPKSMKLGQMINLNVIFHMMGSVYRLVTIRNSPQFPVEFRNGLYYCISRHVAVPTPTPRKNGREGTSRKIWHELCYVTSSFCIEIYNVPYWIKT